MLHHTLTHRARASVAAPVDHDLVRAEALRDLRARHPGQWWCGGGSGGGDGGVAAALAALGLMMRVTAAVNKIDVVSSTSASVFKSKPKIPS